MIAGVATKKIQRSDLVNETLWLATMQKLI